MAYNAKEIWIPCDSQTLSLSSTSESAATAVKSGTAAVTRGLLYGVHIKASAARAGNTTVDVRFYSDSSKTLLLYDVSFNLGTANVTPAVHASDTLATPIPFFATPYFTVTPDDATATDFTVTAFAKALA
tara:strand:+ start:223 stop:612 length:390 start_codon:yes stop_codon:yes gene_type:complete